MTDSVIRATAFNNTVRAFAVDIKNTLEKAIEYHGLNPLAAVALGRALSAVSMMGEMAKGKEESLTVQIKGDGPMGGLVAVVSKSGILKGYIVNNDYSSYGENNSFSVGTCIGKGFLNVIRDSGVKEPYTGIVPLQTGEIGDDIAYYFAYSEQIPSLVALGVKLDADASVIQAGGFIIQLMPGAEENTIAQLEERLGKMKSVSQLMKRTESPEKMLEYMLGDGNLRINEKKDISYNCGCSRGKMLRGVISLGREELKEIVSTEDTVETVCHFCNKKYMFESEEIKEIYKHK